MSVQQTNLNPPIKAGDIVYVEVADLYSTRGGPEWNFPAKIYKITSTGGADLDVVGGNLRSVALERCSHATEKQKAEYFKLVLQFGN